MKKLKLDFIFCLFKDNDVKKRTFSHTTGEIINWNSTFLEGNSAVAISKMYVSFDLTIVLEMYLQVPTQEGSLWHYQKTN